MKLSVSFYVYILMSERVAQQGISLNMFCLSQCAAQRKEIATEEKYTFSQITLY
jgi:hypothetical protein